MKARAYTPKGSCKICQAPENVRAAIHEAIWDDDGVRNVDYRARGVRAAEQLGFEVEIKTITRHAEHVEESWREITVGDRVGPDERVIVTDFDAVMEQGARVGSKALALVEEVLDRGGPALAMIDPKFVLDAAKLGGGMVVSREQARLKGAKLQVDVAALFAASAGHLRNRSEGTSPDTERSVEEMKATVAAERALLAARASGG